MGQKTKVTYTINDKKIKLNKKELAICKQKLDLGKPCPFCNTSDEFGYSYVNDRYDCFNCRSSWEIESLGNIIKTDWANGKE